MQNLELTTELNLIYNNDKKGYFLKISVSNDIKIIKSHFIPIYKKNKSIENDKKAFDIFEIICKEIDINNILGK